MARYRDILRNRNFFLYLVGQLISQFGDRLVQIILVGLVYRFAPGSTMKLAKAFSFTVIPAFFVSPVAGVWVDRWNNKKTMIICDVIRGGLVLTLPAFVATGQFVPIYIAIFAVFTCACFFLPAKFAIIPDLVKKDELLLANSLSTITTVVGGVAGLTIGGLVLELIDIQNTVYLNSVIYFASALCVSFVVYASRSDVKREAERLAEKLGEALKTSFLYELFEGLRYLVTAGRVRFVIYTLFMLTSIVGAIYVVSVVFIQEVMNSMTRDVGLFGLLLCMGLLVGSYLYGKLGEGLPKNRAIYISLLLCGIITAVFAAGLELTASFLLGGAAMFLLGVAFSPVMISSSTIIHESIDENMRGRIFSSLGIVMNAGLLLFMFIASALAELVGKIWILLVSALVISGFGLVGLVLNGKKKGRATS